jgi:hypothetical protein
MKSGNPADQQQGQADLELVKPVANGDTDNYYPERDGHIPELDNVHVRNLAGPSANLEGRQGLQPYMPLPLTTDGQACWRATPPLSAGPRLLFVCAGMLWALRQRCLWKPRRNLRSNSLNLQPIRE